MLFGINYIQQQTNPIISVSELHLTAKDLLLLGGGMFLLFQSVREIHLKMIGQTHEEQESGKKIWLEHLDVAVIADQFRV